MRIACLLIALTLAGCRQKPAEVIEQAKKAEESWRETLRMTLEQWIDDRVPARYVKQIFKGAHKELGTELEKLEKVPAGEEGGDQAVKRLKQLREWVGKNLGPIADADHKKRQEMLGSL